MLASDNGFYTQKQKMLQTFSIVEKETEEFHALIGKGRLKTLVR